MRKIVAIAFACCTFALMLGLVACGGASSLAQETLDEADGIKVTAENAGSGSSATTLWETPSYSVCTISMDTWAALEHHMKYKKKAPANERLIVAELKRCADELASTDVSMQALRDLILEEQ